MKGTIAVKSLVVAVIVTVFSLAHGSRAFAHCDGLDGPVVKAAQEALDSGKVNLVFIWVQKKDEAEVRSAFEKTLAVRKLSSDAKELADRYFFETVVRLHRAGEGAPYTGLKPAGRNLGPAIPAADKSIEEGSPKALQRLLSEAVLEGVEMRFKEVSAKKKFDPKDVDAGREYVKAYVSFMHYVESLYQAAKSSAHGHYDDDKAAEGKHGQNNHKHK